MESKFTDIKVGDTVYINTSVRLGFSALKSFYVAYKVERLTKTQFIVEGGDRFRKDSGCKVGGTTRTYAHKLGDKVGYFNGPVTDQTEEFKQAQTRAKTVQRLSWDLDKASRVSHTNLFKVSDEVLNELQAAVEKFNKEVAEYGK